MLTQQLRLFTCILFILLCKKSSQRDRIQHRMDVILMHDIHGPTADAVDMIVPALKAKGFQMVTVSELAAAKGINLENGGAYGALR